MEQTVKSSFVSVKILPKMSGSVPCKILCGLALDILGKVSTETKLDLAVSSGTEKISEDCEKGRHIVNGTTLDAEVIIL